MRIINNKRQIYSIVFIFFIIATSLSLTIVWNNTKENQATFHNFKTEHIFYGETLLVTGGGYVDYYEDSQELDIYFRFASSIRNNSGSLIYANLTSLRLIFSDFEISLDLSNLNPFMNYINYSSPYYQISEIYDYGSSVIDTNVQLELIYMINFDNTTYTHSDSKYLRDGPAGITLLLPIVITFCTLMILFYPNTRNRIFNNEEQDIESLKQIIHYHKDHGLRSIVIFLWVILQSLMSTSDEFFFIIFTAMVALVIDSIVFYYYFENTGKVEREKIFISIEGILLYLFISSLILYFLTNPLVIYSLLLIYNLIYAYFILSQIKESLT